MFRRLLVSAILLAPTSGCLALHPPDGGAPDPLEELGREAVVQVRE